MKKILILLFAVFLFNSCSDDDENTGNEEQILGTWYLVEATNVPGFSINECTSQSNIIFMMDNTADSEFFTGTTADDCTSESSSGNWSNSNNSQYTFEIPTLGELPGTVNFISDSRFIFTPNDFPIASLTFEK